MSSTRIIDIYKKGTPEVLAKFAISYLIVSTAKQTKESKTGISRQKKAFLRWMDKHGLLVPCGMMHLETEIT